MKILLISSLILFILLTVVPLLVAFTWGKVPPFTNPSSEIKTFGNGDTTYRYVVMGDSTAAGQGAPYEKGIAVSTAKHLAKKGSVTMQNFSISGATVTEVLAVQLPQARKVKPDIVLLSVGANDVNHMTSLSLLERDLDLLISKLLATNCEMKIVLTGAPDMGTVKRFLPPLSYLATWQSRRVNVIFAKIAKKYSLTQAPIFTQAGPVFQKDKTLYDTDNFHPNERGYAVWNTILNKSLDEAVKTQPSHCVPKTQASEVMIEGKMVCLPHKETSAPQTMECAFGLLDNAGTYYGLADSDPAYKNLSGVSNNTPIIVTGMFTPEENSTYQSIGTIRVTAIQEK